MAATLYTGNGSTQSISNAVNAVSFQPDLVWVKGRNEAFYHRLTSSLQSPPNYMSSNATDAEGSVNGTISAITSTGFSVNINGGTGGTNSTGINYVGWQWNAGGTTVTNGVGTISSQVRANTTAGFSVVTYTGTGANATVGHGLGVAPAFIIFKGRTNVSNWWCYHSGLTSAAYTISLNQTAAQSNSPTSFQSTAPALTVFSIGTDGGTNSTAIPTVAYCWAPVAGYSAFGSYTGNGSADGPFIYTGFRPRWLMIKRTDAVQNWIIVDTSRDTYNVANKRLFANLSDAEDTGITNYMDMVSNGFKCRDSNVSYNASGGTYIYAAFAENPLKYANAR